MENFIDKLLRIDLIHSIVKYCYHAWTGQCELHRIGKGTFQSARTLIRFSISLKRSKTLKLLSNKIFSNKVFDPAASLQTVIQVKHINYSEQIVISNLENCISGLNFTNVVIQYMESLKSEKFDYSNQGHVILLDQFWKDMTNGRDRLPYLAKTNNSNNLWLSPSWCDVGFQGLDPSTDLRGMGVLGLRQLAYFANRHQHDALELLKESNHPRRFFPFSATGINMTSFLMDLLLERRLDRLLCSTYDSNKDLQDILSNTSNKMTSMTEMKTSYIDNKNVDTEEVSVEAAVTRLHELYKVIYSDFVELWRLRDPPNIMSFNEVFEELKRNWQKSYPNIEEQKLELI